MKKTIAQLREEIDSIDLKILNLIEERANLVKEVGEVKGVTNSPVYVPEREENIFRTLSKNSNLLTYENIRGIFTEIISSCRNLEKHLTIYTYGELSHLVAYRIFGNAVSIESLSSSTSFINFFKNENLSNENLFLVESTFFEKLDFYSIIISEIHFSNKKFIILKKLKENEKILNSKVNTIDFTGRIL